METQRCPLMNLNNMLRAAARPTAPGSLLDPGAPPLGCALAMSLWVLELKYQVPRGRNCKVQMGVGRAPPASDWRASQRRWHQWRLRVSGHFLGQEGGRWEAEGSREGSGGREGFRVGVSWATELWLLC